MWRRLLRLAHPDGAGEHDLFIWVKQLFDHVAGDGLEGTMTFERRQPPPHPTAGERLDYTAAFTVTSDFADLTARAVAMATEVGAPYAALLELLRSCYPAQESDIAGYRAQHVGASYKQLALVGHLIGMSKPERVRWYRICEQIPLSQRHIAHIIGALQQRAA